MKDEILYHHLVRRLILAPGEATHWHRDVCERVSELRLLLAKSIGIFRPSVPTALSMSERCLTKR
jgi:hypothetical protein